MRMLWSPLLINLTLWRLEQKFILNRSDLVPCNPEISAMFHKSLFVLRPYANQQGRHYHWTVKPLSRHQESLPNPLDKNPHFISLWLATCPAFRPNSINLTCTSFLINCTLRRQWKLLEARRWITSAFHKIHAVTRNRTRGKGTQGLRVQTRLRPMYSRR